MKRASAGRLLLETVQVARHVGQFGLRPVEQAARQAVHAGEELAIWAVTCAPLEKLVGRQGTKRLLDAYLQAKDVAAESVNSLSHQSRMSALQSAAETATFWLRKTGAQTRVVGPFDEHWKTLKVIRNLRTVVEEREARRGPAALQLTPKRFVQFMREAERRKRRARQRDPVEDYIEWMLSSGSLNRMGPMFFEKKIYTDVARIICFAFDRTVMEANGADVWGHQLQVKVAKESSETESRPRVRSNVGFDQVEAFVDCMLKNSDLQAPMFMASIQRQLLVNCSIVILQLVEDLTSDRQMQLSLLGHALRIQLDPIRMEQIWDVDDDSAEAAHFHVNEQAIEELVDALLEDAEVQFVLVPDMLEAEVYRYVIRMVISIGRFVLSRLRIHLFGLEVRLDLVAEQAGQTEEKCKEGDVRELVVTQEDLQLLIDRLEVERQNIKRELQIRQGEAEPPAVHPFTEMASLDRLSRNLAVQLSLAVPIDAAYRAISELDEYPRWMPLCTSANVMFRDHRHVDCELGLGLTTGTLLGTVGDTIRYRVSLEEPATSTEGADEPESPLPKGGAGGTRVARVVADTVDEFAYGKRLVYDWRFTETANGETDVRLNVFFQAKSVLYLPLWDSLQAVISGAVLQRFKERSAALAPEAVPSAAAPGGPPPDAAAEGEGGEVLGGPRGSGQPK